MKILFFILVILHGLIHLLGFLKAFQIREIRELTLPISKPMGLLWLLAAALFVIYGLMYLFQSKYSWLIGLIGVVISQVLVFIFWKDAKIGTLPNLLIFIIALMNWGQFRFQQMVENQTLQIVRASNPSGVQSVKEEDLKNLPEPVSRWIRQSGMIGKPYLNGAKVSQIAEMQMSPNKDQWMEATAEQYTSMNPPAFIWVVDARMNSFLNFRGRDKFENGKGEMLIQLNGLIPIVDEKGEKLDEGSLQRFLGEMVWFPSLALSSHVSWEPIDSHSAKATLEFQGTSGSGTFFFNKGGEVTRFSALRYRGNETDAQRTEWIMDIQEYSTFEGIRVPSKMTSTWKLDSGDWTWLKLEVKDIKYNPERIEF
ncbi:DUF6544 family protein [Algoriphagus confluentis]|uniref:Uncharacterized protein n=1 Tax=Algoriphagus confluentis TaxID=1697556 RepID=A0ABQ6PLX1_9BACT|nr:hypothetical protein Aconfl_16130 [Algoriphagus confluentis]